MQVVAIFFQLHRLHGKDLGHGDVRLENLIFCKDDETAAYIVDFDPTDKGPAHYINRYIEEEH